MAQYLALSVKALYKAVKFPKVLLKEISNQTDLRQAQAEQLIVSGREEAGSLEEWVEEKPQTIKNARLYKKGTRCSLLSSCLSILHLRNRKKHTLFVSSYRNTGSLGEREMLWKHKPQASVSTAFSSSPKFSRVFLFNKWFPCCHVSVQ